jgi:anaerobic magnesium-protoporphyrin IX monomethyl ester cyclase
MTDIVLLQLPFWSVDAPDLGISLLKSHLQENNISCATFDLNAHCFASRGEKYNEHWAMKNGYNFCMEKDSMLQYYKDNRLLMLYYMREINKLKPIIIGCSVKVTCRILTLLFLEDYRNLFPGQFHLLGGPEVAHFMNNNETLISYDYIDAICQDEGENAIVSYVNAIKNDSNKPINGLVYKKNNKVIYGKDSDYISKLDNLPFPDFSDSNLNHYSNPYALPTYTTRGCVNKCNYCSAIGFMTNDKYNFRLRSATRLYDEIVYMKDTYPSIQEFRMCDNISNSKIKNLNEFCDLMIDSGMNKKISWNLENAVIRKEMRKPLYEKLKKAGCTLLGYGMETPSKRLLDEVGKKLAVQKGVDLPAILQEGKDAGLVVSVNVMFGLPTETEEDFNFLCWFLVKYKDSFSMINPSLNFCEYYPGSAGHENPSEYNIDLSKGTLYWDSIDKNSSYLIRMERFEKFCKMAKKFKIDNLFDVQELPNKHKLLFDYYFICKDFDKAENEYRQINESDLTEEIKTKYKVIKTNNYDLLKELDWKDKLELKEYVTYDGGFIQTFLKHKISIIVDDIISKHEIKTHDNMPVYKNLLRKLGLILFATKYLESELNHTLLLIKDLDNIIESNLDNYNDANIDMKILISKLRGLNNLLDNKLNSTVIKYYLSITHMNYYFDILNKLQKQLLKLLEACNNKKPKQVDIKFNKNVTINNLYKAASIKNFKYSLRQNALSMLNVNKLRVKLLHHKQYDKRLISLCTCVELCEAKLQYFIETHLESTKYIAPEKKISGAKRKASVTAPLN